MKNKYLMNRILLLGLTVLLIISTFFLGRYSLKREKLSQSNTEPITHLEIDRGKYIIDVDRGSSKSALVLARYYGSLGITEAQLYWLKKANQMGENSVSKELIEACERSVFDEWRK